MATARIAPGTASAAPGDMPSTTSDAEWKSGRNGYSNDVPLKSGFWGGRLAATAKLDSVVRCCDQSAHTLGYPANSAPSFAKIVCTNSAVKNAMATAVNPSSR